MPRRTKAQLDREIARGLASGRAQARTVVYIEDAKLGEVVRPATHDEIRRAARSRGGLIRYAGNHGNERDGYIVRMEGDSSVPLEDHELAALAREATR